MRPQSHKDHWYWFDELKEKRFVRPGSVGIRSPVYVEGAADRKTGRVFSGQGPVRIRSYRRDFFQGLDLISIDGCLVMNRKNPVRIYFLSPLPSMHEPKYRLADGSVNVKKLERADRVRYENFNRGTPLHKILLPNEFMRKVNDLNESHRKRRALADEALVRFKRDSSNDK